MSTTESPPLPRRADLNGQVYNLLRDRWPSPVVALNRGKDVRRVMPLIKARALVEPGQLEDESVDLRTLEQTHGGKGQA